MHKSVDAPPRPLRLGQWFVGLFLLVVGVVVLLIRELSRLVAEAGS